MNTIIQHLRLKRSNGQSSMKMLEDSLLASVQRYVDGVSIQTHDDKVIVSGQAPTYHHRQLAEQAALAVVHRRTQKRLVSQVAVARSAE